MLDVLHEPQRADDILAAGDLVGVRTESTRYLGTTSDGRYYAGVDVTGHQACLLTLAPEQVPLASCVSLGGWTNGPLLTIGPGPDGSSVALLPTGLHLPKPWIMRGPHLAVRPGQHVRLDDT